MATGSTICGGQHICEHQEKCSTIYQGYLIPVNHPFLSSQLQMYFQIIQLFFISVSNSMLAFEIPIKFLALFINIFLKEET